jgi:hypothetical protein
MPIFVKRLSDGSSTYFDDITEGSFVRKLKRRLRKDFKPAQKNGCRLVFNGHVLKSRHTLKHYNIHDNSVVEMDDTKNWSSSSSSSSSED